jgi:hypothetical protein
MSENSISLVLMTLKNSGQIMMFDYFHRDNTFSTLLKINLFTFFVILIKNSLSSTSVISLSLRGISFKRVKERKLKKKLIYL